MACEKVSYIYLEHILGGVLGTVFHHQITDHGYGTQHRL
jgi:hypothetical protein